MRLCMGSREGSEVLSVGGEVRARVCQSVSECVVIVFLASYADTLAGHAHRRALSLSSCSFRVQS